MSRHVWLGLIFATILITGARCLRNVTLEVIPEAVEHGHEATLRCHYDLEGVDLYSLKWYRGSYEFYRYSPSDKPAIKIFNFPWISIDRNNSNERQVTIRNVDFPLSGNFSCEVTTDAPTFLTATNTKTLTVVSVPKGKPVIRSERGRYDAGETLKANCSAPSSKPPARLTFTLNNVQVGESSEKQQSQRKYDYNEVGQHHYHHQQSDDRQWTQLSLLLQPFHYDHGQLTLRCTAEIPGVYVQTSEIQLGTNIGEPIPERVTSENASDNCHRIADLTIVGLILLHLHLR